VEHIDVVPPRRQMSTRAFVLAGIVVALVLAFLVAPHASSSPDGLEKVAADQGIDASVSDHALASGPLADYGVDGVADAGLGTGLAGVVGVTVTGAIGLALFAAVRHGRRRRDLAHVGTA
jgi:cobalt/nickel transport system permease protein